MQVKVQVVDQRRENFTWKRGKGVHYLLMCIDCDTETPLGNFFYYVMTPEEADEYFGRLHDKIIRLGISELRPLFGYNFQAKGKMTVLSPLKPRVVDSKEGAE
jgi:hypothetical protein